MSLVLVLPAVIVVIVGCLAGVVRWPVRPATALRLLTVTAGASAATVLFVAGVGVVGVLARSAVIASFIDWCPVVPLHHEIGAVDGVAAFAVVAVSAHRVRRVLTRRRRAMAGTQGRHVAVLETGEPIAYAAPGRPGCVVVSRGMLDALTPRERQVLFAHERAHLHQRHDRYLLVGELAVAVVPILRPLADQIRLATERCADEYAAHAVGGDRRLVARSIGRAAVRAGEFHALAGAFGGGSVPARIRALLDPPPRPAVHRVGSMAALAIAAVTLVAGSVQFHHMAELIEHICG